MKDEKRGRRKRHNGLLQFFRFSQDGALCPCCGAPRANHVSRYPAANEKLFFDSVVIWCENCGSGYVPEADKLLGDYYVSKYAEENRGDRDMDPGDYFESIKGGGYARRAESHLVLLRRHGANFGRVLDFGSGPGYFLKMAEPKEAFAVEPDTASRKYLDYLGAKTVDLDDIDDGSLDLIEASHTLEHLSCETVASTLATLGRKLTKEGYILMEVPHAALSHLRVSARHEPHTLFFTAQGFQTLIRRCDLTPVVEMARGSEQEEATLNPIYTPPHGEPFLGTTRKALMVLARRKTEDDVQ